MLWSIASEVVQGLWIGFSFAVLLCVFFSVANIYFAYRAIRDERRRGIYISLWKQPDFLRMLGLCLMMFNGLLLVVVVIRGGGRGNDVWEIVSICVELLAIFIFIRAILIIRQRRQASV